jgi:dTDP-4-dehydrorhamnose reductase
MRLVLLGKNGQLGWELRRTLAPLGEVLAVDYPEIDFNDLDGLRRAVTEFGPQVIINAAAYTAVDRAEAEPEAARRTNAQAPGALARIATELGAAVIHYSTDFVFDGTLDRPYLETDPPNPLNVYAQTKLEGEQAVLDSGAAALVLRTAWMYSTRRDNYVLKVLRWARTHPTLRVVTDQVGSPTSARMLAEITAQTLARAGRDPTHYLMERRGLYHLGGDGAASRYEWAEEILHLDPRREEQTAHELLPALSADFPDPARRPLCTPLDCHKFGETFGLRLPPWREALRLVMEQL